MRLFLLLALIIGCEYVGVFVAEKVTLLELPDKNTSAWKWNWSKSGNKSVWNTTTWIDGRLIRIQQIACDLSPSGQPNSWLRSNDILVRDANRLEISVTYTARNCSAIGDPAYCGYNFDLYKHQSKTRYRTDRIPNPYMAPATYRKVGTFTAKLLKYYRGDLVSNIDSLSLVVENARRYVYLALHYRGGCIAVVSLAVMYYRCPQMTLSANLITLPLTVTPIKGSQRIKGTCVQHSQPLTNVDDLYGYCQSDGEWSTAMFHGKCLCIAGYEKTTQGSSGSACTAVKESSNSPLVAGISVLGSILGIVLFISVVLGVSYVRKKRQASQATNAIVTFKAPDKVDIVFPGQNQPQDVLSDERITDDIYSFPTNKIKWEIPSENLTIVRRLGSGNFGHVDKATAIGIMGFPGKVYVAVKSLKDTATGCDKKDFLTEMNLMKSLEPHPRVVRLLGCCTKSPGHLAIVLEYLSYGDLLGYLRRSRGHEDWYCSGDLRPNSNLTSQDLMKFAWMIADGMCFLAQNKCVHRDLAARNVLVGENKICKISDLGLARDITEKTAYTRQSSTRLPVKWMPPESIFFGQSTIDSDVWSYGIVLWEIFTIGDSPYPKVKGKDMPRLLREGYRMPKPRHLAQPLYSLMLKCWQDRPKDRPTFEWLCHQMNLYSQETRDYINLDVFDDALYVNFDAVQQDE